MIVHPGYFFDFAGEAFVVVSLLPPPGEFDEAIDRLLPIVAGNAMRERHAGVLMPLFSAASSSSWGIGELGDVAAFVALAGVGGVRSAHALAVERHGAGSSHRRIPRCRRWRSTRSTSASLALGDFETAGGTPALGLEGRMNLEAARARRGLRTSRSAAPKRVAMRLAFDRFSIDDWQAKTPRAAALAAYIERERSWLDDYALYVALAAHLRASSWRLWPERLRDRDPAALADARRELARDILPSPVRAMDR